MKSSRIITELKKNWKFTRNEEACQNVENIVANNYDFDTWQNVTVPHDWAVAGPFSADNDVQITEVVADGIMDDSLHLGRTGGLPIVGMGIYKTTFTVDKNSKNINIEFDGVMSNSQVYVNGALVGGRPYGYTSFTVDVTNVVKLDTENTLVVTADQKGCASRWYPGAGIYRAVRLVETQNAYVAFSGTYITSTVENAVAKVIANIEVCGSAKNAKITNTLFAPNGLILSEKTQDIANNVTEDFAIENPQLWDICSPNLYKIKTVITNENNEIIDIYTSKFGVRTITFSNNDGFTLNGKRFKMNGVCLHHDLGAIGTAVNKSAIKRQLEVMRKMGCNAIRTSHNPASRELLDLCDEMGFIVIEEAFDEWKIPKVANGYSNHFDKWAKADLVDMIKRDRNHPCIIMWSIGNEIMEQRVPEGKLVARYLNDIVHETDITRPTTMGINNAEICVDFGFCDEVDVIGFNYRPHLYEKFHKEHPEWIIYGSETESVVSSRGVYLTPAACDFPAKPKACGHISSYDLSGPAWAYPQDKEFAAQDKYDYVLGEFVWTGFDYLGEPTPFRKTWPSHSSYFGIVDLAGIPKDRFYAYQSKWTKEDVLHVFPHWNWQGYEKVTVHAHSNADTVELFVNGKSQGVAKRNEEYTYTVGSGKCDEIQKYRFIWEDVPYEAGELYAVSYNKNGEKVKEVTIKTAGDPYQIILIPEKTEVSVKDEELCYVRVGIYDKDGNLCPNATNKVEFTVTGAGEYVASDAGDQTCTRTFSETYCNAFSGQCMAIAKGNTAGIMKITATSGVLNSASVNVVCK